MNDLPIANVLPLDAVKLLQQAAQTPIFEQDPLSRINEIDSATQQIKRKYPQFFKE